MNSGSRSVAWLVFGPIASFFAAYLAFLLLGLVLGAGFDMDHTGTPLRKFFISLALPVPLGLAVGGTLLSLCMALLPVFRRRR